MPRSPPDLRLRAMKQLARVRGGRPQHVGDLQVLFSNTSFNRNTARSSGESVSSSTRRRVLPIRNALPARQAQRRMSARARAARGRRTFRAGRGPTSGGRDTGGSPPLSRTPRASGCQRSRHREAKPRVLQHVLRLGCAAQPAVHDRKKPLALRLEGGEIRHGVMRCGAVSAAVFPLFASRRPRQGQSRLPRAPRGLWRWRQIPYAMHR